MERIEIKLRGWYEIEIIRNDFIVYVHILRHQKPYIFKNPSKGQTFRMLRSLNLVPLSKQDGKAFNKYIIERMFV